MSSDIRDTMQLKEVYHGFSNRVAHLSRSRNTLGGEPDASSVDGPIRRDESNEVIGGRKGKWGKSKKSKESQGKGDSGEGKGIRDNDSDKPGVLNPQKRSETAITVEFTLKFKSFKWDAVNRPDDARCNIIRDDRVPVVQMVTCHNLSNGLSYFKADYTPGGIRVSYDIERTPHSQHPYTRGTEGVGGDTTPVDSLKLNFYTHRPPLVNHAVPPVGTPPPPPGSTRDIVSVETNVPLFLLAGYIGISELGKCLAGSGMVLRKDFGHNFTQNVLGVEFSEAVVTIGGLDCSNATALDSALDAEIAATRMKPSLMHNIIERSTILAASLRLWGSVVEVQCTKRPNSIAPLLYSPFSFGLQQFDLIPLHMFHSLFRTNWGPVCPEYAAHFTAHAFNIMGLTPSDMDRGRVKGYQRAGAKNETGNKSPRAGAKNETGNKSPRGGAKNETGNKSPRAGATDFRSDATDFLPGSGSDPMYETERDMFDKDVYINPRKLDVSSVVTLLHTVYQGPTYSAEFTPYTSDIALTIADSTIRELMDSKYHEGEEISKHKWKDCDTEESECISSAFSVPVDEVCYRADDCEGGAAAAIAMEHNMRAVFYDATRLLANCGRPAGDAALASWLHNRCNIHLPTAQHFAFAVQLVVLSACANMCVNVKVLIIGALAANPMMTAAEQLQEGGHCANMVHTNEVAMQSVIEQVYSHYYDADEESDKMDPLLWRRRIPLALPPAAGPALKARYKSKPPDVDVNWVSDHHLDLIDGKQVACTIRWPACTAQGSQNKPLSQSLTGQETSQHDAPDISDNSSFYMLESTTSMHIDPVHGHASVAKMKQLLRSGQQKKQQTGKETDRDVANKSANEQGTGKETPRDVANKSATEQGTVKEDINWKPTAVPVTEFLKGLRVDMVREYADFQESVRLQGFMHEKGDTIAGEVKEDPSFYNSLYVMDDMQCGEDESGNLVAGANADNMLSRARDASVKITLEKIQFPGLTEAESIDMEEKLQALWVETRMPSMSLKALLKRLNSWKPATITDVFSPERSDLGDMRCTVGISGANAEALFVDMSKGGKHHDQHCGTADGIVSDMRVIQMGLQTTLVSQNVRVRRVEPSQEEKQDAIIRDVESVFTVDEDKTANMVVPHKDKDERANMVVPHKD